MKLGCVSFFISFLNLGNGFFFILRGKQFDLSYILVDVTEASDICRVFFFSLFKY